MRRFRAVRASACAAAARAQRSSCLASGRGAGPLRAWAPAEALSLLTAAAPVPTSQRKAGGAARLAAMRGDGRRRCTRPASSRCGITRTEYGLMARRARGRVPPRSHATLRLPHRPPAPSLAPFVLCLEDNTEYGSLVTAGACEAPHLERRAAAAAAAAAVGRRCLLNRRRRCCRRCCCCPCRRCCCCCLVVPSCLYRLLANSWGRQHRCVASLLARCSTLLISSCVRGACGGSWSG
eukprot:362754-Chlamydomonas_euryale.AAC.14